MATEAVIMLIYGEEVVSGSNWHPNGSIHLKWQLVVALKSLILPRCDKKGVTFPLPVQNGTILL